MSDYEGSEFGAGIVVCVAKFSEHLWNRQYQRVNHAIYWHEATPEKRDRDTEEATRFPHGDASRRVGDAKSVFMGIGSTPEVEISLAIEMWMNGASDHFYDLDREKSPPSLVALADLALKIGHGFTGGPWGKETVDEILRLWKESCISVDKMLGVDADWGQW